MKQIRFFLLPILAILFSLTSCQEDEFEYDEIIDIFNFSNSVDDTIRVEIGGTASFSDASKGFKERYWEVGKPSFFTNNEDQILSEEIAHVQFMKLGMDSVTITLVYEDSIEIEEYQYLLDASGKIFKRDFMVEVLDSIKTSFGIKSIEGNYTESNGKYMVEAGSRITFEDQSTGGPDTYKWMITGFEDTEFEEKEASVLFHKTGKYDVTLITSRVDPIGKADTLTISEYIEVIPSTLPVAMIGIEENKNGEIRVQFNRELETPINEEKNITIRDNDVPVVIKSVTLDTIDPSVLVIKVEENIKNSHTATISYNAENGNLSTKDLVEVSSFTNEKIALYAPNLLVENPDFEDGTFTPFTDALWVEKGNAVTEILQEGYLGSYGLKHSLGANSEASHEMNTGFFALDKTKKYALEFYVKVIEDAGQELTIRLMPSDGWYDEYKQWMGVNDLKTGEDMGNGWVKKHLILGVAPDSWESTKINMKPISGNGKFEYILDNFKIYVYEE